MGDKWNRTEWGDRWARYFVGDEGPAGQQLPLPGMPEPPRSIAFRALVLLLERLATPDGVVAPGHDYLARYLALHPDTIRRLIRQLRHLRALTLVRSGYVGRASSYRLDVTGLLADVPQRRDSPIPPSTHKGGSPGPPLRAERGGPSVAKGGSPGSPPTDRRGAHADARTPKPEDARSGYRPTCPLSSAAECSEAGQGVMCPVHGRELRALDEQQRREGIA